MQTFPILHRITYHSNKTNRAKLFDRWLEQIQGSLPWQLVCSVGSKITTHQASNNLALGWYPYILQVPRLFSAHRSKRITNKIQYIYIYTINKYFFSSLLIFLSIFGTCQQTWTWSKNITTQGQQLNYLLIIWLKL